VTSLLHSEFYDICSPHTAVTTLRILLPDFIRQNF